MPRGDDEGRIIDADATVVEPASKKRSRSKAKGSDETPGPSIDEVLEEMKSVSDSLVILVGEDDGEGAIDGIANELGRIGDALEELVDMIKEGAATSSGSTAGKLLANGLDIVGEAVRSRRGRRPQGNRNSD